MFLTLAGLGCFQSNAGKGSTEAAEKVIKQSTRLRNLDEVCRNLPVFDQIEPEVVSVSTKSDTLFYYYKIKIEPEQLQTKVKERLLQNGWLMSKEVKGASEFQIEFEKENYWIQVGYNEFSRLNYSINCKDSAISK